ncbi:hypothetical protein HZ326_6907 [Fusarium oxysporum f. sp. albedinis]|nr:hypothetical protein HZ326_6907 [Fusarium oxysporum f. sp. albedinis]
MNDARADSTPEHYHHCPSSIILGLGSYGQLARTLLSNVRTEMQFRLEMGRKQEAWTPEALSSGYVYDTVGCNKFEYLLKY